MVPGVTSGRKSAPHFIITERIAFVCLIIKRREHQTLGEIKNKECNYERI